jgi:hypothetical protein
MYCLSHENLEPQVQILLYMLRCMYVGLLSWKAYATFFTSIVMLVKAVNLLSAKETLFLLPFQGRQLASKGGHLGDSCVSTSSAEGATRRA